MMSLYITALLMVYFAVACPQSYNRRPNRDYDRDYDYPGNDWEFANPRQRLNGFQNRLNDRDYDDRDISRDRFRHMIEDRSYDLAYGLGQGYGQKLGQGIKTGISEATLKKFLTGFGAKPEEQEKEGSPRKKDKEEP